MTSINVKFRPSAGSAGYGTIYYQIRHEHHSRQLPTDFHILPAEWNKKSATVVTSRDSGRTMEVRSIRDGIKRDTDRLVRIIRKLDDTGMNYSADDVVEEFHSFTNQYKVSSFMGRLITGLRQSGKVRTAENYKAAFNSFHHFLGGKDIVIDVLTTDIMGAYQAWLRKRGLVPNTVSFYARILRAVYNRAVNEEVIENRKPFRHIYTGVDKTVKRALSLSQIKRISTIDLHDNPRLDFARDVFMLSFMLRGMNFIDMAFLKKTDLNHGYITYRRHKTGQLIVVKWTKEMQTILNKYPSANGCYLFPIISHATADPYCEYRRISYRINYGLKTIGRMVGTSIPVTLYVARHSWASAARAKGIPLSVISEGMGHDSERTTMIYLSGLDTGVVDRANRLILKCLE